MKKIIYYLLLLSFITSCSEEATDKSEGEETFRIFTDSSKTNEVLENDTLDMFLFSDCKLYIETSHEKVYAAYDKRDIAVECINNSTYLCTPQSKGIKKILFVEGSVMHAVYFKVRGLRASCLVSENTYTIETTVSDEVKKEILYALSNCSPQEGNLLEFYYENLQAGIFSYEPAGNSGTFTIYDETNLKLTGDKLELNFTLQSNDDNTTGYKSFLLTQDLTDSIRKNHPGEEINKVLMTSIVLNINMDYYY